MAFDSNDLKKNERSPLKDFSSQSSPLSLTKHQINLAGKPLAYIATAGTLSAEENETAAKPVEGNSSGANSVFFAAYTKDQQADPATRPITFILGQNKGLIAAPIHLAGIGPKRIRLSDEGQPPPPPCWLTSNNFTLLDESDLVFIEGAEGKEPLLPFILAYLSRYQRFSSPKFLLGDSDAGLEALSLIVALQQKGIQLNGAILLSPPLNHSPSDLAPLNLIYSLPTYAAAAFHHKKLSKKLQKSLPQTVAEAENFALNTALSALFKGHDLKREERENLASLFSLYSGVDLSFFERCHCLPPKSLMRQQLLSQDELSISQIDARLAYSNQMLSDDWPLNALNGALTTAFYDYFNRDLQCAPLTQQRDLVDKSPTHLNGLGLLQQALKDPHLKVFLAYGLFDLKTPYFATQLALAQIADKERLSARKYLSGHFIYTSQASQVASHMKSFIKGAIT